MSMKNWVLTLLIIFSLSSSLFAESLEQKKSNLKKALEVGAITKVEYNKSIEHLKNLDQKKENKELKKNLSFTKKKKDTKLKKFLAANKEDKEKITLKKIEELGQIIKFDDTYFTDAMIKEFGPGCNNSFKCRGGKAGQSLSETFSRSKAYGQKNPGKMIKAMAMFEVFYASKLWYSRKSIERYKENNYKKGIFNKKTKDEKEIRSLFGINKGRLSMRNALGMNSKTPTKEAIKKFWLLGEFLDLGKGVENEKLDKDLKERQELLEDYKLQIANLKKKLQKDKDKEENEKSFE